MPYNMKNKLLRVYAYIWKMVQTRLSDQSLRLDSIGMQQLVTNGNTAAAVRWS